MIKASSLVVAAFATLLFGIVVTPPADAGESVVQLLETDAMDGAEPPSLAVHPAAASGPQRPPATDKVTRPAVPDPDPARFGPQTGRKSVPTAPADLCKALSFGTAPLPVWKRSALPDQSFECFAQAAFTREDGGGSLFAMSRGRAEARVDSFRLKLNLPRTGDGKGLQARGAAESMLERLSSALRWRLSKDLADAVDGLVPFKGKVEGAAVEFRKEFGPVPRWNLIVDFSAPSPMVATPAELGSSAISPADEPSSEPRERKPGASSG